MCIPAINFNKCKQRKTPHFFDIMELPKNHIKVRCFMLDFELLKKSNIKADKRNSSPCISHKLNSIESYSLFNFCSLSIYFLTLL